jgi:hypothetical protein
VTGLRQKLDLQRVALAEGNARELYGARSVTGSTR